MELEAQLRTEKRRVADLEATVRIPATSGQREYSAEKNHLNRVK